MVAIIADKEIHSTDIIIQVSLKEGHSAICLIMVMVVTAMDTQIYS